MIEFLVLAVSIFVAIAAVILGFVLAPWFFLLVLLLAPLTAVLYLRSQTDGEGSILEATSLVALGFMALAVLTVGLPAIILGILLHPLFFLLLLLLAGLLAAPLWLTSRPDTHIARS